MSALAELQRGFQAYVLDGGAPLATVAGTEPADARARLDIYAQGYRLRLLEVLGNDFPGLRALTGPEEFERLCRDYIAAHPSAEYNLRWYGAKLGAFLVARPAFAEMAEFEWNLTLAFDAADAAALRESDLAALPPERWTQMPLGLHPSLRRQRCRWNTAAIRRAVDREEPAPESRALEAAGDWLIWRQQRDVRHRALEADEAVALDALAAGASFGDLCERLCAWHAADAVALRAAALLKRWVADECLRAFEPGDA